MPGWASIAVVLLLGSAAFAAPDGGAPPPCTPVPAASLQPEVTRLEAALAKSPGDPLLLFEQAIVQGQLCDRARTLERLSAVARTWGGLDPGAFRGFRFLWGDPEFEALVRDIRARNRPVLSSEPAYVLAEPGLFPEGMAFDARTGRVYAGSAARQRLVWTDRSGTLHELVASRTSGLGFPAGMKVDAPRNRLCVASAASFGPGRELPDAVTGILCFALDDGRPVRTLRLPAGRKGFLNDLAIDAATGALYTTNTSTGAVMRASLADTELRELLPDDAVSGANGIALDASGRVLFVAGDEGITRVDLGTRKAARLERAGGVVDGSIDGLYYWKGSLVGIQNGVHPGRVLRFQLDRPMRRSSAPRCSRPTPRGWRDRRPARSTVIPSSTWPTRSSAAGSARSPEYRKGCRQCRSGASRSGRGARRAEADLHHLEGGPTNDFNKK